MFLVQPENSYYSPKQPPIQHMNVYFVCDRIPNPKMIEGLDIHLTIQFTEDISNIHAFKHLCETFISKST